jgi:hypothetical protein
LKTLSDLGAFPGGAAAKPLNGMLELAEPA